MDRDDPIYMTVRQTADLLQVCDRTVYRQIKAGRLPAVKVFGEWRVPRSAITVRIDRALSEAGSR